MVDSLTKLSSGADSIPPENRVWGFMHFSVRSNTVPSPHPLQPRRKIRPTATKSVSGIPYWPSRDPIGENGGMNLYGFVRNNGVNDSDILGGAIFGVANPTDPVLHDDSKITLDMMKDIDAFLQSIAGLSVEDFANAQYFFNDKPVSKDELSQKAAREKKSRIDRPHEGKNLDLVMEQMSTFAKMATEPYDQVILGLHGVAEIDGDVATPTGRTSHGWTYEQIRKDMEAIKSQVKGQTFWVSCFRIGKLEERYSIVETQRKITSFTRPDGKVCKKFEFTPFRVERWRYSDDVEVK